MRCSYCFYRDVVSHREVSSHGIMSYNTLETLIRRAFAFSDESVSFVFQGGEPMMAGIEFYKTAASYQKKYNSRHIRVFNTIQTNGTLIDDEFADFFGKNRFLVGISIDGDRTLNDKHRTFPDGSGSYDRIKSGIELLKKHKVDFNVIAVVSKDSARDPEKVYSSLKEYGYLQFIPLIDDFDCNETEYSLSASDFGRFLTKTFDLYYRDIKRGNYVSVRDFDSYVNMVRGLPPSSCAMLGKCGGYFTVEADGSVYPCDFYVTDEFKIGNINEASFFSLSKSQVMLDFIESSAFKNEKCLECKWLQICRGGCRRHREPFPSVSKFCEAYSYFFDNCYDKLIDIRQMVSDASAKR